MKVHKHSTRLPYFTFRKQIWLAWWMAIVAVFSIHISILQFDSRINQDEVQIVDYGRASLNPDGPWAMSWNVEKQMPVLITSYLGPVIQELAFNLTAPSDKGVMVSSLLGAVLAATLAMGWLIARQVPLPVSFVLAFAFLADPALSITYQNGRVDGWAMSAVLGACWVLRYAGAETLRSERRKLLIFIAGMAFALSLFIWPTSVMLAPLIFLEFLLLIRTRISIENLPWLPVSTSLISCFVFGAAVAAGLLSIPIFIDWEIYLEGLKTSAAVQARASVIQPPIIDLVAIHDPMIVLVTVAALFIRRELGLLLSFAAAALIAWQTMIYPARLIYFLPYLLAMIGAAAQALWHQYPAGISKVVLTRLLAVLIAWNATLVLIIRPFYAFQQGNVANSEELITELDRVIGEGQFRVLVGEWAPYFAGRALGWKIFTAGSPIDKKSYDEFLLTMDYILVAKAPLYANLSDQLQSEKFELLEQIDFQVYEGKVVQLGFTSLHVPEKGYKSILVYRPVKREAVNYW